MQHTGAGEKITGVLQTVYLPTKTLGYELQSPGAPCEDLQQSHLYFQLHETEYETNITYFVLSTALFNFIQFLCLNYAS